MFGWLKTLWGKYRTWKTGKPWDDSKRSPHWPALRKAHLLREPYCQWCGGMERLQAHHIFPFHLFPYLELVELNVITLCEPAGAGGCHLSIGHRGKWSNWEPNIRKQCEARRLGIFLPTAIPPSPLP